MRKRGNGGEDVLTLDRRVLLKTSFDSGDVVLYNETLETCHTYSDVLNDPSHLIDHSPKLGNGTYGEVLSLRDKSGKDVAVMKVTACGPLMIGFIHSPFRSENIEPRLLNWLWNKFVATGITPHIIAPLGDHAIVNAVTWRQQREDDDCTSSLVYFMEKASAKTMRHYLGYIGKVGFTRRLKVLLFQVCYTLGAIQIAYPRFRHNDLKDDNILLNHTHETGYVAYTIYGKTYYVPNIGVTALIADYDFASISGSYFDNYKTMEQSFDTPSYNINARVDHSADICTLIQFIRHQFSDQMTAALRDQLASIFGEYKSRSKNANHPNQSDLQDAPTIGQIFEDTDFFDEFLTTPDAPSVSERYVAPTSAALMGDEIPSLVDGDYRECPIFRPRNSSVHSIRTASMRYFSKMTPRNPTHDAEVSNAYNSRTGNRILQKISMAYRAPYTSKTEEPGHGFPPEKEATFLQLVQDTARSFLEEFHVPIRWWCAVYTCAFVDACYDMCIVPNGQRCWKMEDWIAFWSDHTETTYTAAQMLHFSLQYEWLRK